MGLRLWGLRQGIKAGDKVLVPTFTFTATAEVVRYLRADPVFVHCDRETFCITMEQIENAVEGERDELKAQRLKAIIPVHLGGHPCDMDPISEFANENGLKVMEDAAHAIPTRYKPRLCRSQVCRRCEAEGT